VSEDYGQEKSWLPLMPEYFKEAADESVPLE
jgi:hypothetical protein